MGARGPAARRLSARRILPSDRLRRRRGLVPVQRLGALGREVVELDRRATRWVVRDPDASPRGPGHLLARRNALPTWGVVAAALAASGPRGRHAAGRALLAATTSSVLGDRMLKPVLGRQRPEGARRASASFPSGHACTGSAFATAVTCEWPAAGVLAGVVSAFVSTARVRDGEHHVSDVLAGTAFGITVALALRAVLPSPPAAPRSSAVGLPSSGPGRPATRPPGGHVDADPRPDLLDTDAAAARLGVDPSRIPVMVEEGLLPTAAEVDGRPLFEPATVDAVRLAGA